MASSDFEYKPAAGFLIGRTLKREDLQSNGGLDMPDDVNKVSDSVAFAEIIAVGDLTEEDEKRFKNYDNLQPGMIVGFMPYTDKLIECDYVNYSVVALKHIMVTKNA